jgi:two-component sensor histidine kinase
MRCALFILILLIHFFPSSAVAQRYREQVDSLRRLLSYTSSSKAKVDILNAIALNYQRGDGISEENLDSCIYYGKHALALSKKINYTAGYWVALDRVYDGYDIGNRVDKAFEVIENIYDTHVVKMLYSSAAVYKNSIWRAANYDSALVYYRKALKISREVGDAWFIRQTRQRMLNTYINIGDTVTALQEMKEYERDYTPHQIAATWLKIGGARGNPDHFPFKLSCYQHALDIYRKLDDKMNTGIALLKTGAIYDELGDITTSEQLYLEAIRLLKQTEYPEIYEAYLCLHDLYYYKGDLDKAVYYSLEAIKSAERYKVKDIRHFFLYDGNSSSLSLKAARNVADSYMDCIIIKNTAQEMIKAGKSKEALDLLLTTINRAPNYPPLENLFYTEALDICYASMGRYVEAEQQYLQMMTYVPALKKQFAAIAPYTVGKFYYETGQYAKAVPYLYEYLRYPREFTALTGVSEAHLLLYRIDSTRQDHSSALQHFRQYKGLTDSLFSATKSRQIAELKVQYDIEKKDQTLLLQQKDIELLTKQKLLQQSLAEQKGKDVLLKQQSIDLLKQQQSLQEMVSNKQQRELERKEKELGLQEENIGLLHNKEQLQESQLRQANFIKKMTIAGILLLLVIVGLLYNQYRIKHRNNRRISEQNDELHKLLEEKEWLLKEVHHRVKNNLQVVLSLLQSQSVYLKDEALAAVHVSQHRVQAMSLIHQKLYQTDNVSTINMDTYIPELVDYLKDSFLTRTRIVFVMDIAPVALDVTQAVPLGLIINEAVTNIFKHAFPDRERGQVRISLQSLNEEDLMLEISDNGTGLPANASDMPRNSLGLNLMKGLCRDFNGRYTIESYNGTHIQVVFNRHSYQPAATTHS